MIYYIGNPMSLKSAIEKNYAGQIIIIRFTVEHSLDEKEKKIYCE